MLQHLLLELRVMGVGWKMAIGPFGRAGVLMVGITGTDSPVPIIGVMPGMGLIVVRVEVIGIGVRIGTLGIIGTFGIVPMPAESKGQILLIHLDCWTAEHLSIHTVLG